LATVVARAQDGELAAFEQLINEYSGPIFRLAYRMLGDRGHAEEVTQDTLVSMWHRLNTLARPEAFRSWLFNIATRRCLDVLRARQRQPEVGLESGRVGQTPADSRAANPETAAGIRDLDRLVDQLPPEQRACWLLRDVHQLSYQDIATTLQIPPSTVRGRIARARAFLAEKMDSWR
jgi:RNA polymerase sigma-70 factor (ECF subfamily)